MSERDSTSTTVGVRPDIITDEFLAIMRSHGVVKAYLFGSVSRGEERPDSDLELLVTLDPSVMLFQQVDLMEELSQLCGRRVDLMTGIHPVFEPYITPTPTPLPV